MRPAVAVSLMALLGLLGCDTGPSAPAGTPVDDRTLRFAIEKLADCEAVNDYPYARNLFCPASFLAAQSMVSAVAKSIGAEGPPRGFFSFYQTRADPDSPPDDQSQTTVACQQTRAPWRDSTVVGMGAPL